MVGIHRDGQLPDTTGHSPQAENFRVVRHSSLPPDSVRNGRLRYGNCPVRILGLAPGGLDGRTVNATLTRILRATSRFLAALVVLWIAFFALHRALPYIQPGVDLVYAKKLEIIDHGELFRADDPVRVVLFGESRVLSGFVPEELSKLSGGRVAPWNFGIGGRRFDLVMGLGRLCAKKTAPTHVLVTLPALPGPEPGFDPFHPIREDKAWLERLFPFRRMPRNLTLFALRSRKQGGLSAFYAASKRTVDDMVAARGYHFIAGMSHYPGHKLPDDYWLS